MDGVRACSVMTVVDGSARNEVVLSAEMGMCSGTSIPKAVALAARCRSRSASVTPSGCRKTSRMYPASSTSGLSSAASPIFAGASGRGMEPIVLPRKTFYPTRSRRREAAISEIMATARAAVVQGPAQHGGLNSIHLSHAPSEGPYLRPADKKKQTNLSAVHLAGFVHPSAVTEEIKAQRET